MLCTGTSWHHLGSRAAEAALEASEDTDGTMAQSYLQSSPWLIVSPTSVSPTANLSESDSPNKFLRWHTLPNRSWLMATYQCVFDGVSDTSSCVHRDSPRAKKISPQNSSSNMYLFYTTVSSSAQSYLFLNTSTLETREVCGHVGRGDNWVTVSQFILPCLLLIRDSSLTLF